MDPFGLVVMIIASNFAARLEPHPSIHPSVRPSDMALVNLASARHVRHVQRAAVAAMARQWLTAAAVAAARSLS